MSQTRNLKFQNLHHSISRVLVQISILIASSLVKDSHLILCVYSVPVYFNSWSPLSNCLVKISKEHLWGGSICTHCDMQRKKGQGQIFWTTLQEF